MQVALLIGTSHQDHVILSQQMSEDEAKAWISKIDASLSNAGLDTVETSWGTFRRGAVSGAYISG